MNLQRIAATILLAATAGCATVQPFERGYLAKPEMSLDGDPAEMKMLKQTFASKEAAAGGQGVGGGGCGCN